MSTIDLNGGQYTAAQIIQAIAESNDPEHQLNSIQGTLTQIEARLHAIEEKLAAMPTDWTIH